MCFVFGTLTKFYFPSTGRKSYKTEQEKITNRKGKYNNSLENFEFFVFDLKRVYNRNIESENV